jgi:hypothetical protein
MTKMLPFTYDIEGFYTNQKCFIMTGDYLEYLVAFFNSKLFKFCFTEYFPELQGNSRELNKVIFELIPVQTIKDDAPYKNLVNEIITMKMQSPSTNTSELENQIDNLIYQHYNLSEEEIYIIENA